MSPASPKVTCQGNQLTIVADNSTLGSVLAAVRVCIGVAIDIPDDSAETRTYLNIGPGTTRKVLDALLSSTDLDYAIQSSNAAPDKIQMVLLMARSKDTKGMVPASGLLMTPARRAWLASRDTGRPASVPGEDVDSNAAEPELPAAVSEKVASEKIASDKGDATEADPQAVRPLTGSGEHSKEGEGLGASAATQSAPATSIATDSTNSLSTPTANLPASGSPSQSASGQDVIPGDGAAREATAPPVSTDSTPSDSSQQTTPAKELENKINNMQQLFEQRKKLNANPASPSPQN